MSRTRNEYNGHVIHVTSFPLVDNKFTVHFDIEGQRDGRIEVRHFESGAGLRLGQQKIDSDYGPVFMV
jgi:hypothetical protein